MYSASGSASSGSGTPSAQTTAAAQAQNQGVIIINPKYPLWAHVTKLPAISDPGGRGGNARFLCHFCKKDYPGSYSRVRGHLLRIRKLGVGACEKLTFAIFEQLQKEDRDAENLSTQGATRQQLPLPPYQESGLPPTTKKRKGKESVISESFHAENRHKADSHIARLFFTAGLPFNVARNPEYRASFNFVANHDMGGYVPPGYNALRTTLLQKEKKHVERMLQPIKSCWPEKGVTIAADGWTDPQRRPILNFIAVSSGGPMFLKSIETQGEVKSKEYIFERLKEVIEEVGPDNVVQVITDNAANCKAAGLMLQAHYKNIFWTPCIVHTLNLALKNICDPKNREGDNELLWWIKETAEDASFIKNYIMNHGMRLSMFNEFSKLKFLHIAETRFASVVIMFRRFLLIKEALVLMVVHPNWSTYREDDPGKAEAVKDFVLNDVWWDRVKYIVDFTGPIYSMIRRADTDQPCLHLIYEQWDTMIEEVKAIIYRAERKDLDGYSQFYDIVYGFLVVRWNKSNTPLHCLAHSLNPKYYTLGWINGGSGRMSPNDDGEITEMRNKCLRKFFPNQDDFKSIKKEFADFALCDNASENPDSIEGRSDFDAKQWWGTHGSSTRLLKNLALKLLGQPASSSCCERNWSTYAFIHSMKRNRLTPERAEDLVFVHNNLRLLSRSSQEYKSGPSRMWDVGGDGVESFTGVGMLEGANLSFDEPEFEEEIIENGA